MLVIGEYVKTQEYWNIYILCFTTKIVLEFMSVARMRKDVRRARKDLRKDERKDEDTRKDLRKE